MNFPSIVLLILVGGAAAAAVRMMIRRRAAGKYNSCGGCTGCSGCGFSCGENPGERTDKCSKVMKETTKL